uniref:Uncharacterized protein n=1 Tax=Kalanchoe fedtschenkoi TaxID=63787 RepID=A0A7N0TFI5_KALFE
MTLKSGLSDFCLFGQGCFTNHFQYIVSLHLIFKISLKSKALYRALVAARRTSGPCSTRFIPWTTAVRTEFTSSCTRSWCDISSKTYPRVSKVACFNPADLSCRVMFVRSVPISSGHNFCGTSIPATLPIT